MSIESDAFFEKMGREALRAYELYWEKVGAGWFK